MVGLEHKRRGERIRVGGEGGGQEWQIMKNFIQALEAAGQSHDGFNRRASHTF